MLDKTTAIRLRYVLISQIVFVASLICMGLLLVIASLTSVSSIYWSCAVLNVYFTVMWLCLALGCVQVLLGTGIGIFLYLQPKCAKEENLVLIGPEGNQLGEITERPHQQGPVRTSWVLRFSTNTQARSHRRRCCSSQSPCFKICCCCCFGGDEKSQSKSSNTVSWFKPLAIIFFLIIAAHIAAISLTVSFISRAQNTDTGLQAEVENLFIEAKTHFFQSDGDATTSAAAKCWDPLEKQEQCCGMKGPWDWLTERNVAAGQWTNASAKVIKRCACQNVERGICDRYHYEVSPGVNKTFQIFSRGCGTVVCNDVLRDLRVLKYIVPLSLLVVFVTCLLCVVVTIRVAHLEMGDREAIGESHRPQPIEPISVSELGASAYHRTESPNTRPATAPANVGQNRLSQITGPALRTLTLE